jgi:UDPglucose 6-dehydrogenase
MGKQLAVIGTGYVGLSTGVCMAHLGHHVVCVDLDESKIDRLRRGEATIVEHRLPELLRSGIDTGHLTFTTDGKSAVADADFVFMCVQTPQGDDGAADLRHLFAALDGLRTSFKAGAVVINKSTVPVGTAREAARRLARPDIHVASNPEFLREGSAIDDFLEPDRIVVGCDDPAAAQGVAALYRSLGAATLITDPATSETVKYASNAFLAMKLSFVNDMAALCESLSANVDDVVIGMGLDRRIGKEFLRPGPGWGGSCFPKDSRALVNIADGAGHDFELMRSVISSNLRQFDRITDRIEALAGAPLRDRPLMGVRIAVWGLTFKAGTDDLRDSPAIEISRRLADRGAVLSAYDPTVRTVTPVLPDGIEIATDCIDAARDAHCVVVLTEWPEFAAAEPAEVGAVMAARRVFDGRNLLDAESWTAASFAYERIGR